MITVLHMNIHLSRDETLGSYFRLKTGDPLCHCNVKLLDKVVSGSLVPDSE